MRVSNVHPILPRLTVNANFIGEFISARAPCFALVLVEERKQQQGFLALRTSQPIPANVTGGGFRFGHTLLDNDEFSVIQFVLEFYDFATFNVLVNPKNTIVRTVLSRMVTSGEYTFFAIDLNGTSTAFQSGLEQANRVGLRTNFPVIESATTTSVQGDRAVAWFDRAPTPRACGSTGCVATTSITSIFRTTASNLRHERFNTLPTVTG